MNQNFSNIIEIYPLEHVVSHDTYLVVGIYCAICLVLSVFSNTALIAIVYKNKKLHSPLTLLKVILAIVNLIASLIEFPSVIYSSFSYGFMFGEIGCIAIGFVMYFVGCFGVYSLIIISFERYWMLRTPNMENLSYKICTKAICACLIVSLVWSVLPITGVWSYYSLEGINVSCSVEWTDRSSNVVSYNMTILVTVFALPLVMLTATNLKLICILKTSTKSVMHNMQQSQLMRRYKRERSITIITMIRIVFYICNWFPYAIVSIYIVFVDNKISPLMATIPSLFAKTSLVWPSLWTLLANKKYRRCLCFWENDMIQRSLTLSV